MENKYSLSVGAWHGRQGRQEGRRDDDGGEEGGGEAEVIDFDETRVCISFFRKLDNFVGCNLDLERNLPLEMWKLGQSFPPLYP